jgi:hypothetical protein
MFGRHEFCRVTLEDGKVCPCECGEAHGTKYVKGDLDTPIHRLFRKVFEAHKEGKSYSDSEEFKKDSANGDYDEQPVVELNYTRKPLPITAKKEVSHAEDDDNVTLEELEAKRD